MIIYSIVDPTQFDCRAIAWIEDEVDQWVESRIEERDSIAEIIAALVRNNHTVALFSKEIDLAPPPVPEFLEAVQKDDHLSFFRPGQDYMQVYPVCFNKLMRI